MQLSQAQGKIEVLLSWTKELGHGTWVISFVWDVKHVEERKILDHSVLSCPFCQARVQVQGLSQISNKIPGPGA